MRVLFISSFPPRLCGIATFLEEAIEFLKMKEIDLDIHIISHLDGKGKNVYPLINLNKRNWYMKVAEKIQELKPDVVHIQHEYGLYNYVDFKGRSDNNKGFLKLLDLVDNFPTVVEAHTVHGRLKEKEKIFIEELLKRCTVLILKCDYQRWRLSWTFKEKSRELLKNITVVPHGARPDKRYGDHEINSLKEELDLSEVIGRRMMGLVGWIQPNKRWDIVISMWEELEEIIFGRTGENWILFAAGDMRDPNHRPVYLKYIKMLKRLEEKGKAKFFKFNPHGDIYYKVMAICDFVVLPSIDETQSGTLARIIALNKPYVTTAPLEGLTSQTLENDGGLLFTNRESLRRSIVKLASDESLRRYLGDNLKWYLDNRVNWEIITNRYLEIYEIAKEAKEKGEKPDFPEEF